MSEDLPTSQIDGPRVRPSAALMLFAGLAVAMLAPLAFAEVLIGGLSQLHLSPPAALSFVIFMFAGAFFNIPVYRIERAQWAPVDPLTVFGLGGLFPALRRIRRDTVIAVNVGGCLAPLGLAVFEFYHLAALESGVLIACAAVTLANSLLCFSISRPIDNVGIVMPVMLPAATSAILAISFAPGAAAPVAFIAGVLGPLIGADLMHLPAIARTEVGVASIGGAGTFDGILLSGLLAAYLS